MKRNGFSLVEVVIAMAVVAILLTSFVALFGPAQRSIQRALSTKEAQRLTGSLNQELTLLREQEVKGGSTSSSAYGSSFEKAFEWVLYSSDSSKQDDWIILYQYKANPNNQRSDGTLGVYDEKGGVPGVDFVIESAVRRLGNAHIENELESGVVQGAVYAVRLLQYAQDSEGKLVLQEPGSIVNPGRGGKVSNVNSYEDASLAFEVEFYLLKSNDPGYVVGQAGNRWNLSETTTNGGLKGLGKPVARTRMAVSY